LDIALEGYNPNTSKAMAVEQCQCPQPYKGLSCEDCAPGYYRSQTGPYGGYCVPCQCNGHSDTCDQITGVCYVSIFCYRTVSRSPDSLIKYLDSTLIFAGRCLLLFNMHDVLGIDCNFTFRWQGVVVLRVMCCTLLQD
jgi:hypothetical protein